jgi:GDPmannose 4,6-dehydratase
LSDRRALVIGAAGQDGSYLCELLAGKGYAVTGIVRGAPEGSFPNLEAVRDEVQLVQGELGDFDAIERVIRDGEPQEIYNLAAVSFAPEAWNDPVTTVNVGAVAVTRLLEAVRNGGFETRFFQASSAWVFGRPDVAPQNERTPYAPVEPYGAAKAFGDFMVSAYRERHGLFCCSGILYNHESPRRPERFVSRKITKTAAAIKRGLASELVLGNVEARRDWGYAKDFVEAAWLMLQGEEPADYVVATGETHSVREFAEVAFRELGLDWTRYVRSDSALGRGGGEVHNLVGDASAARERLGWRPSVAFDELVRLMVAADLAALS